MKSLYLPDQNAFIRYHELPGEPPTCVYLAGLMFPSVANFLSTVTHPNMDRHHALLIDYLGAGSSDHPTDFDYTLKSHAQAIAAVLDHEAIKQCAVIGFSMGGSVGIMLAILRPDLVSNLIVAEGNLDPGGGTVSRRIAAFSESEYVNTEHNLFMDQMRKAAIEGDGGGEFFTGIWSMSDPYGIYRTSVDLVNLDPAFRQQYFEMSIPRTFIYGGNDVPSSEADATPETPYVDHLKEHGIRIAVVPDAGHGMMWDNLPGFVDVLKTALKTS
jgi:pimeloyl-ACP methyl ester carboxylesterase